VGLQRLTSNQIANTLTDLLGVPVTLPDGFPRDDRSGGYVTTSDAQVMSPVLVEQHLALVLAAVDRALRPAARPPEPGVRGDLRRRPDDPGRATRSGDHAAARPVQVHPRRHQGSSARHEHAARRRRPPAPRTVPHERPRRREQARRDPRGHGGTARCARPAAPTEHAAPGDFPAFTRTMLDLVVSFTAVLTLSAACVYCSASGGGTHNASALLSKPFTIESAANAFPGGSATPRRSRKVLVYSARVRRRVGAGPGSARPAVALRPRGSQRSERRRWGESCG
jgi:hypothetical protein